MRALYQFAWLELRLGNAACTNSAEVVFVVDAGGAAEFLVALFLPLGDEV